MEAKHHFLFLNPPHDNSLKTRHTLEAAKIHNLKTLDIIQKAFKSYIFVPLCATLVPFAKKQIPAQRTYKAYLESKFLPKILTDIFFIVKSLYLL